MSTELVATEVEGFEVLDESTVRIGSVTFTTGPTGKVAPSSVEVLLDEQVLDMGSIREPYARCGTHLHFDNGWTLSVQWGTGNYCDNRNFGGALNGAAAAGQHNFRKCPNAEILLFHLEREVTYALGEYDDVRGWITPTEVLAMLPTIARMSPTDERTTKDWSDK